MKKLLTVALVVVSLFLLSTVAMADGVPSYNYATPVFGLAVAPDGSLLVADAGSGIVELRKGKGSLVTELPGVADIAPIGRGSMFAITGLGAPDPQKLFRVSRGHTAEVADLFAFEQAVNPDGGDPAEEGIDSNPFDVEALGGGRALVADAGGNDLLIVDAKGNVDWVAAFPPQLAPTDSVKSLVGCPTPPPGLEFVCDLPPVIPAQAVPTSVAIGPDGAYYVGELVGFPSPTGMSRVWRIEPGTRHAACGTSPACTVVADGFTSIVDLAFGPHGELYVVELDEAGFGAVELGGAGLGGTVNRCDSTSWDCTEVTSGLTMPIAVAVDRDGTLYAAVSALIPGAAQVITLP